MQHVIRTQIFEVNCSGNMDAFHIQHTISEVFYRFALPVIEKVFDEIAPGKMLLQIDRLEIDLGDFGEGELQKPDWQLKLKELLRKEIVDIIYVHKQSSERLPVYVICEQWLYYMQRGYLPWNVRRTDNVWYRRVLEAFASDYHNITTLRAFISSNATGVKRIVSVHDESFLVHLLETITSSTQGKLPLLIDVVAGIIEEETATGERSGERHKIKSGIWERLLLHSAAAGRKITEEELVPVVIIKQLSHIQLVQLRKKIYVTPGLRNISGVITKVMKHSIDEAHETRKADLVSDAADDETRKVKIPEEGIFVTNAGVVLLHPFLFQFFRNLELVAGNEFISPEAHRKALVLLHYLGTGETDFEEHMMVVSKLLCGYSIEEPVEKDTMLSIREAQEADELLLEVINRWSILKNTSIAALRETFLQRSGKIIKSSGGDIRLLMEAEAVDVLLQHLPWNIGIIHLPWMSQLLKVEWK